MVDNKEELDNKMILYQKEMVRDNVNIINVYLILNFILKNGKNGGYAWNSIVVEKNLSSMIIYFSMKLQQYFHNHLSFLITMKKKK